MQSERSAHSKHAPLATLRARVVLLFLIALVPTAVLHTSVYVLNRREAADEASQNALRLARLVAAEVDRDIGQTHQLLAVFTEHPSVVRLDGEGCSRLAASLLTPIYTNIGAAERDGDVFCSAVRQLGPVNVTDRLYFRRVMETGVFVVGEYQIGRITKRPGLNLAYPIRDGRGGITGVAFAALDLARVNDMASQVQLPAGGTLSVLDENGTILARYPDPEPWVGQRVPESDLRQAMQSVEREGAARARGLDGVIRLYGIADLPSAGPAGRVQVSVGIPTAMALSGANRGFIFSLGGILVVASLALAVVLLSANALLLRPFRSLTDVADRLRDGDFGARIGGEQQLAELRAVAGAFDRMAAAIQQREAERDRAEERITQQLQTLTALYAGAQRLTRSLEPDIVTQEIARMGVTVFEAHGVWLARKRNDGTMEMIARYPADLPHAPIRWDQDPKRMGPSGRAIRSGFPVIVNDLRGDPGLSVIEPALRGRGIQSVAAFPLISRDIPFGVLTLAGEQQQFFDTERVELLQAFANQAAAALENARLYEDSERRIARLGALRAIDQAITGSLDLRLSLAVLLQQVTAVLQVDAAGILLFNPHTRMLETAASRGYRSTNGSGLPLRLGEGFAGKSAMERRRVEVPDLTHADGVDRPRLVVDEGFVSYYAVPLVAKGEIKGVLEVCHRAPIAAEPEWLEFLEALAGQAAIAVDNATLFEGLQRSNLDLTLAYDTTLEGWSRALDLRDKETEGHTERVAALTIRLARAMGVEDAELVHIRRGALLHDIGKMGIPDSILLKPGPLTDDEWVIMRKHPVYALELLSPIAYLRPALDIPYAHHEKWDGTGYPRRLKETQIPLAARIFAVADVWDALTSDRPYRPAWPPEKAMAYIRDQSGRHFDAAVIAAFLRDLARA